MNDSKASPVKIVEQDEPVPVTLVDEKSLPISTVARSDDMVASPTTTAEQNLVTKGQRSINLIWESTQSFIAISITGAVIYCDIMGIQTENLGKAFVLIIAIYFVRMNHIKVGGVKTGQEGR